jgi:hypothetical protein
MDDDLHEQVLQIEAHIEQLADVIERCRKIILISKAAVVVGGTLILATIIGAIGFDPTIMIGAIAAAIGGTVVFGSNMSTLKQTVTNMKAAEAHRTELIGRMDLRVVGDGAGGLGTRVVGLGASRANANSLRGRNSARFPKICATVQRDNLQSASQSGLWESCPGRATC